MGSTRRTFRAEPFHGEVERVRRAEGERVLARITARERLVVLDERGERLDTSGFASLVDAGRQLGPWCSYSAAPTGTTSAVRAAAWRTVRLSDLVFNHEVARVVLYEQLYRALTF